MRRPGRDARRTHWRAPRAFAATPATRSGSRRSVAASVKAASTSAPSQRQWPDSTSAAAPSSTTTMTAARAALRDADRTARSLGDRRREVERLSQAALHVGRCRSAATQIQCSQPQMHRHLCDGFEALHVRPPSRRSSRARPRSFEIGGGQLAGPGRAWSWPCTPQALAQPQAVPRRSVARARRRRCRPRRRSRRRGAPATSPAWPAAAALSSCGEVAGGIDDLAADDGQHAT